MNSIEEENRVYYHSYYGASRDISFEEFLLAKNMFECINPRQQNKTILEVGYGSGTLLKMFAKSHNCNVHGYEISESARTSISNLKNVTDHKCLACINIQFDFIVLSNVIEHINDDKKFLSLLYELLKEGGSLCLTFPTDQKEDNDPRHFRVYNLNKFSFDLKTVFPNSYITYKYLPPTIFLDKLRTIIISIGKFIFGSVDVYKSKSKNIVPRSARKFSLIDFLYRKFAVPILKSFINIDLCLSRHSKTCQGYIEIKK